MLFFRRTETTRRVMAMSATLDTFFEFLHLLPDRQPIAVRRDSGDSRAFLLSTSRSWRNSSVCAALKLIQWYLVMWMVQKSWFSFSVANQCTFFTMFQEAGCEWKSQKIFGLRNNCLSKNFCSFRYIVNSDLLRIDFEDSLAKIALKVFCIPRNLN